jgi:hypothetical protein
MKRRRRCFVTFLLVLAAACGRASETAPTIGSWAGTITTEGNVTTVVNESGSVWGGKARLVEEASIGVESGAPEYMLGRISSVHADGQRIAVLDPQARMVRLYDYAGNFIANVGGPGEGPGELRRPELLTMDGAGAIYVLDVGDHRIHQFAADGGFVTAWSGAEPACCIWKPVPAPEGRLWMPVEVVDRTTRERRSGFQLHGPEGPEGEVSWLPEIPFDPPTYRVDGRDTATPLAPRISWNITPAGGLVAGAGDRYRFETVAADGSKIVVERYWEPTPIDPDEREWWRRLTVAMTSRRIAGWSWDGAEIPRTKPAFSMLVPAMSGDIWVRRDTGTVRLDDCMKDPLAELPGEGRIEPCFRGVFVLDVFGSDGRYLGEVETPPGFGLFHADGETVVAVVTDEAGTLRVKRYRLVAR